MRAAARSCMVTMAPEIEGVDEATRFFCDQGIVCSAGHTSAKYREGMLAIGLGFRTLTHAFNAMPPLDHRDPSILAAFMQEPRTTVQVICDGYHVSPVMVDIAVSHARRASRARDRQHAAGRKRLSHRRRRRARRRRNDRRAARCTSIRPCATSWSYAAIPFEQAIVQRDRGTGRIARHRARGRDASPRGKRADLSIWSEQYEILATIVGGEPVFGAQHLRANRATSVG